MAGIIHKIEEKLHMGGGNDEKKAVEKKQEGEKHKSEGEKKEGGLMDKIKDKIPETKHGQEGEEKKSKKKKKKEKKHGHDDSSSSSDSD